MAVAFLLIYYFTREEVTDWGYEIWDLTKKIFPILVIGTFALGVLAFFIPPETFKPFFGTNSLLANFLAAFVGAILYMPTLLEVPVIGTTLGYLSGDMAKGPALALLLTGPSVSLPSLLVLYRIIGGKKTLGLCRTGCWIFYHGRVHLRQLFLRRRTMSDDKPCCAADALRRIRQVKINGILTGITMLDESIAEVRAQNPGSETEILAALMKKIKIYNYVPKGVEAEYARALMEEYKKALTKN